MNELMINVKLGIKWNVKDEIANMTRVCHVDRLMFLYTSFIIKTRVFIGKYTNLYQTAYIDDVISRLCMVVRVGCQTYNVHWKYGEHEEQEYANTRRNFKTTQSRTKERYSRNVRSTRHTVCSRKKINISLVRHSNIKFTSSSQSQRVIFLNTLYFSIK